jgi:hypothetical protein
MICATVAAGARLKQSDWAKAANKQKERQPARLPLKKIAIV